MGRFLLQISVSCYFDRGKYKLKKGCNSNILGEEILYGQQDQDQIQRSHLSSIFITMLAQCFLEHSISLKISVIRLRKLLKDLTSTLFSSPGWPNFLYNTVTCNTLARLVEQNSADFAFLTAGKLN